MFYLFGDISGKATDSIMMTAAYLGPERNWVAADRDWNRALKEAKVPEFHATDFFACRGAFKGWKLNGPRHVAAAKRFTGVAPRHSLAGFAYGIELAAFTEVAQPALSEPGGKRLDPISPRLFCATQCLLKVAVAIKKYRHLLPPGERIAVFFEQEKGIGEVIDWFDYCKKRRQEWTNRILSIAPVRKAFRPVQIADLLAHEAWRQAKSHLAKSDRPQRKSLDALTMGTIDAQLGTRKSFVTMLERLRAFRAQRRKDQE